MRFPTTSWPLLLAGFLLLPAENASAQNRSAIGFPQQNQQGDFRQNAEGAFGETGQIGPGQGRAGLSQQGGAGQQVFGTQQNAGLQGGNRQDSFVGSDSDQIRNQQSARRQQRRALFDFAVESLNEMRESRRQQRAGRNQKSPVRVQIRPLFTVQQPLASELSMHVRTQFGKALPTTVASAQITIRGGRATIEGRVKSDYDKQLAAKMLSLQPGISQVENRLTVEPGPEAPRFAPAR